MNMDPVLFTQIYDIAKFAGAVLGILALIKVIVPWTKSVNNVVEDWAGEKSRPGVPGRDGVMVRLENIENQLDKQDSKLDIITNILHDERIN